MAFDEIKNGTQNQGALNMFGNDISKLGPKTTSTSNSSSFSGLDQGSRNKILSSIIPQLTNSASDLSGLADRSTDLAAEQSRDTANKLAKESLPAIIQQLAAKGTLNSSFGGQDMLSQVLTNLSQNASDKTYDAGIQSAAFKQQIPTTLAGIADLGKYSQNSGSTSSSSTNELAPYSEYSNLIQAMMQSR